MVEMVETLSDSCKDLRMETVTMTGTAFRRDLTEALDRVHAGAVVEVTHYNRPMAFLVPPAWYRQAAELMAAAEQNE